MNGLTAIIGKEMRSYFWSPVAYVVIGLFLALMGIIFAVFIKLYQDYTMAGPMGGGDMALDKAAISFYQSMSVMLCFLTPFVTMRLFAEEKRQQTLELLLTSPIRSFDLVVAKFLSAMALTAPMIACSLIYVLFLVIWGNPDINITFTSYIGIILAVGCFVSLGTFVSALTSSQAIAAILTYVLLFILYLLEWVGQSIQAKLWFIDWGATLKYISPITHLASFTEGVIHIKDAMYLVSFICFMLFLTHRLIESNRWR